MNDIDNAFTGYVELTPRSVLDAFLRTAPKDPNRCYTFQLTGSVKDGERFVHRIRVDLARLRKAFRASRKIPPHFMIKCKRIQSVLNMSSTLPKVEITLEFRSQQTHSFAKELVDIMTTMGTGVTEIR